MRLVIGEFGGGRRRIHLWKHLASMRPFAILLGGQWNSDCRFLLTSQKFPYDLTHKNPPSPIQFYSKNCYRRAWRWILFRRASFCWHTCTCRSRLSWCCRWWGLTAAGSCPSKKKIIFPWHKITNVLQTQKVCDIVIYFSGYELNGTISREILTWSRHI